MTVCGVLIGSDKKKVQHAEGGGVLDFKRGFTVSPASQLSINLSKVKDSAGQWSTSACVDCTNAQFSLSVVATMSVAMPTAGLAGSVLR